MKTKKTFKDPMGPFLLFLFPSSRKLISLNFPSGYPSAVDGNSVCPKVKDT